MIIVIEYNYKRDSKSHREGERKMKATTAFYRVYRELTDENGNVVHKTPSCACKDYKTAAMRARVWGGAIYAVNKDGTETRI